MKKVILTALLISVVLSTAATVGTVYRGNTNSKIFHRSSCLYFNSKNCTAVFTNRNAAISAGYRPCKICKP